MPYTPTDWEVGDIITEALIDQIEQGIADAHALEVRAYSENDAGSTVSGGATSTIISDSLTIPAAWGSWDCMAWASGRWSDPLVGGGALDVWLAIDGTDLNKVRIGAPGDSNFLALPSVVGMRTGLVTTGARTVALRANPTSASRAFGDLALMIRAYRTG